MTLWSKVIAWLMVFASCLFLHKPEFAAVWAGTVMMVEMVQGKTASAFLAVLSVIEVGALIVWAVIHGA
jgi:hypothetical protein